MSGKVFQLNGRAQELLGVVRPGVDPRTLAKVATHLDRMVRSGLPPASIIHELSPEAKALLAVTFDESLGRTVVRSLLPIRPERSSPARDGKLLAIDALMVHNAPTVANRPDSSFTKELDGHPPQAVRQRLRSLMGRAGSTAAISTNPVRESWLTYDEDVRPSSVHRDTASKLLVENGFTVVSSPNASSTSLVRCQAASDVGLLLVTHGLFTAHREGANSIGNRVVRDVRVNLQEAFAVDLGAVSSNLGVSVAGLFEGNSDDAKLLLAMAVEERDGTMVSPVAASLVAEHYAQVDTV